MSIHVSLPSNASHEEFTENTNGWYKVRLARRLRLPEGRWEVGLVDMHFSNTWHNVTDGKLKFQEEEGRPEEVVNNKLEVEGEIEVILDALSRGLSPPPSDFYRSLATLLAKMQRDSQLYSREQLLSLQSVLARLMIAYADNTSSVLLNPSRGDVPGLAAMRTQLDLIISQHNKAELSTELEPQPRQAGDLSPLKDKKPVRNIAITHGRYVSVFEVVGALRSAIYTANLHRAIRILYDTRLNKVTVFVSSDARGKFWFTPDLCQILGLKEGRIIGASERYESESVPDIERGMTSLYVYSNVVDSRFVGNSYVPLLRTVPIRSSRFVNEHVEFANIQYLPVAYTDSEVIEIRVCRDNGRTVYFNGGKVIVNLHFRQVRN